MNVDMSKKKNLYLIMGVSLLLLGVFIFLAYRAISGSFFEETNIRTIPLENPEGTGGFSGFNTPEEIEEERKSGLVQSLANKTPLHGTNFSFYFSYDKNQFILYLNPQNQTAGNTEFDQFLNENRVESRSWISNLTTTTVKPTL